MEKKAYRTFLPFDGGLSPSTDKSTANPLFGDTPSIEEIVMVERRRDRTFNDIRSRDWNLEEGDKETSFRETGDEFMLPQKIEEILKRMLANAPTPIGDTWVVVDSNEDVMTFPSQETATRTTREKGIKIKRLFKIPAKTAQQNIAQVYASSCFKIASVSPNGMGEVGAAFCIGKNTFATCAHCVKKYNRTEKNANYKDAQISIFDGVQTTPANVISFDPKLDIAVLSASIDAEPLLLATKEEIVQGSEVFVIGSPMGYENNISSGIISGIDRTIFNQVGAPKFLFTDANVLPGNSGGPVVLKESGKVCGMMAVILSQIGFYGLNAAIQSPHIAAHLKGA